MPVDQLVQRAWLLLQQDRFDLAERELRGALTQQPEHPLATVLLVQCLVGLRRFAEARDAAGRAVALQPDDDLPHAMVALVAWHEGRLEQAVDSIATAIALDPDDVQHHALQAQIRLSQRRWPQALASADAGLALEPEHTDCLNLRAIALAKLGRANEANDTLDASLAADPDNAYTHQARGHALLHRGDAAGAMRHFQQALRQDPNLGWARHGLVEALKARIPVYRVLMRGLLWFDRFPAARQVQITIGLWLVTQFARRALSDAGHTRAADIVSYTWLLFVLLSFCTVPIFNLLLLLHPLGRHALARSSRREAMLLGGVVLTAACFGIGLLATDSRVADVSFWFWLLLTLPVAGIGLFHPGLWRRVLQAFVVVAVAGWGFCVVRLWDLLAIDGPELAVRGTAAVKAAVDAFWRDYRILLWAVALSTWYVMLAPKGRPRMGLGADS